MKTEALFIKEESVKNHPDLQRILVGLNTLKDREDLAVALLQKYDIKMIDDGLELLKILPKFQPHLVIVESELNSVSGFQITHLLKDHPELSRIPLVLLLAHGYQISEFWSREEGVDSCLHSYELNIDELMEIVSELLEKSNDHQIDENNWLRIEKQMTGAGFVQNLSTSLDQILMESTVLNRIALLAQEPTDFRRLTRSIMILLRNILEYSAGAIRIFKNNEIYSYIQKEMADEDRQNFLDDAVEYSDIYLIDQEPDDDIELTEIPLGLFHPADNFETASPTIFTVPLVAPKKTLGTLTLLTHKSAAKREYYLKTLELVAHHIALALNNALLYQEVHRLSTVDELTSLPNRRAFYEIMKNELTRSRRFQDPLSLAILDIDHFKVVNDTHGHLQGDKVLQECGKVFRSSVRDKVDTVARFGGEEFIILFPRTDLERAKVIVDRLHKAIENHPIDIVENSGKMNVTISIGLVTIQNREDLSIDEIINAADKALYSAKDTGRNRIVVGELPSPD